MAHRRPLCSIQTSRGPTYTSFNTYMLSFFYYNLVYLYLAPPFFELASASFPGFTSPPGYDVVTSRFLLTLSMRMLIPSLILTYQKFCHTPLSLSFGVIHMHCPFPPALLQDLCNSTTLQFCCPFHSSEHGLADPRLNRIFQFRLKRLHFGSTFFKHPQPP